MIRKATNNNLKGGNIAKIKYFLPSGRNQNNESKQISKSSSKYKKGSSNQSYCGSKDPSKMASRRPSKYEPEQQQSNLNNELSFQIVGISDADVQFGKNTNTSSINVSQIKARPYQNQWPSKSKNKITPLHELLQNEYKNKPVKQQKIKINQMTKNQRFQTNFKVISDQISNRTVNTQQISSMLSQIPNVQENQQFMEFVQRLKYDQNYQNTISMFTIMYFYESKQKLNNKQNKR